MFLNELTKNESVVFISLVESLAKIDEEFGQNEITLIKEYMDELSLTIEEKKAFTLEDSIKELTSSSKRIKNIIFFELIGLALADGTYCEKEVEFLNSLASAFEITNEQELKYLHFFKEVKDLYDATCIEYESKIERINSAALELLPV